MSVPGYVKPVEFTTGQVIGRANMDILRDNDDLFNALADRWRPPFAGSHITWIGDDTTRQVFDGWILLEGDAETLYYSITVSGGDAAPDHATATLYFDYGGVGQDTIDTQAGNGTSSGSYDMSGFDPGLYRIYCKMTRTDNGDSALAFTTCIAPYAVYTGGQSYTAGTNIVDGNVSAAADFNKWRTNDIFFDDNTPRQVAFCGMKRSCYSPDILFDGWIKWHPDQYKVYYGVWLATIENNAHIDIYFDYDAAVAQQSMTVNAAGTTEGTWALANPGNYTKGTYYRVRVELDEDSEGYYQFGEILYMYFTAPDLDASYTVMDSFTVGQFVYGSTAAQLTRLDYLTDNDASIYDRLVFGAAVAPRNVCCQVPSWPTAAEDPDTGDYRLVRRFPWLYYRTTGAELRWGNNECFTLEDHGDDDYLILNLNSLDIPEGAVYQITGDTLEFAQEMP